MKLVLKEKVFTLKERFNVTDEQEQPLYSIEGKFFSWGHQFDVEDASGTHVAHIQQKVLALLPRYFITCDGMEEMELKGHLNIIHPHYTLETPDGDWEVRGDFLHHEYTIQKGEETIANRRQEVVLLWRQLRARRGRGQERRACPVRDGRARLHL